MLQKSPPQPPDVISTGDSWPLFSIKLEGGSVGPFSGRVPSFKACRNDYLVKSTAKQVYNVECLDLKVSDVSVKFGGSFSYWM